MLKAFTNRVLPLVLAIMMVVTLVPSLGGVAYADEITYTNANTEAVADMPNNYGVQLYSDKAEYAPGEDIYVKATGINSAGDSGWWVGIFDNTGGTDSSYWTYVDGDFSDLVINNTDKTQGLVFQKDLGVGKYYIIVLGDSGRWAGLEITIKSETPITATVTTDKDTYTVGEPIMVSCVTNDPSNGWVAIYPSDVTTYGTSMMWYYPDKSGNTPKDILTITESGNTEGIGEGYSGPPLPAGEYQAVYLDPSYNKIGENKVFTVVEPDPTISTEEMNDMAWGDIAGPNVITSGDKVFWGYIRKDGTRGVASYDKSTGSVVSTDLATCYNSRKSDTLAPALLLTSDNKLLCAYPQPTSGQKSVGVSLSESALDNSSFSNTTVSFGGASIWNCQLVESNGTYYLFARINENGTWAYSTSTDGITWSTVKRFFTEKTLKYNCIFAPTTEDGIIRVMMNSEPTAGYSDIRMVFLDTSDNKVYSDAELTTDVTSKINRTADPQTLLFEELPVVQATAEGKTQKILDVAVTAPDKTRFLFASFTAGSSDSVYKLYDNGKVIDVCNGGDDLIANAQLGASFRGTSDIVAVRNADGKDYIEEYSFDGKAVSLKDTLYTHEVAEGSRAARPIVDANGEAFLWFEGTYTAINNFDTNAKLMFFESEMTPELPEAKLSETSFIYNGNVQKPTVTVGSLVEGTDYTLTWSDENSTEVGDYTVTVTYTGEFTGEVVLQYSIVPDPYADYTLELVPEGSWPHNLFEIDWNDAYTQGKPMTVKATVPDAAIEANAWLGLYECSETNLSHYLAYCYIGEDNGKEFDFLKKSGYEASSGYYRLVLFTDSGYNGLENKSKYIFCRPDASNWQIKYTFDTEAEEPVLAVVANGEVQVPTVVSIGGKAPTTSYLNWSYETPESKDPGKYNIKASFNAVAPVGGSDLSATYELIDPAIVKLSSETFTNNGEVQKPTVTVEGDSIFGMPYEEDLDYEVVYENADSKDDGTYKVTVNFIGSFGGSVVKTYTISHEHAWGEGVVTTEPTCKDAGVKTFTCSICGQTKTEEIPATGEHTWNEGTVTTEPTCVAAGEKTFTCTVCGETKTEVVPATGEHTWDEGTVTTEPTCEKAGVKTFKCTVCEETKTEEVTALGHDFKDVEGSAKEATCGAEGKKADQECSRCHEIIPGEAIPATGEHKWDEGKVTKEATVDAEGEMTYTCTVCGETKTEKIDKLTPPTPVEPAAEAKVTITVSNAGELATATDGSVVADKELAVEDLNKDGKLTYDEALQAAHAEFNTADGFAVAGGWVTKFWGIDGAAASFMLNGEAFSTTVDATEVKEGDKLTAILYKDTVGWTDVYSYFETANVTATYGDDVTLTLMGYGVFDGPSTAKAFAGVAVKTADGTPLGTTDENGKVTFNTLDAGTYTVTAEGTVKGTDYSGNEVDCPIVAPVATVEIAPKEVTPKVTLSKKAYAYTGSKKKPTATVKVDGNKLDKAEYTVTYNNNVNVGLATATVTLGGNYTGTAKATFKINPKGVSKILTPKAAKKAITVRWKAQKAKMKTKRITGYNVWVSTSKKFTKKTTVKKFAKGYSKTSYKVTKLKAKKLYYVKVRTYKKIGSKTYYSKWSAVKKIKTK